MVKFLEKLRNKCVIGLVGGSDLVKIQEQMDNRACTAFDFTFGENGLTAFKGLEELKGESVLEFLGEERLKKLINFTLHYIADLDIPQKRGTFIEFRKGMLNISPIGRNCNREERNAFEQVFTLVVVTHQRQYHSLMMTSCSTTTCITFVKRWFLFYHLSFPTLA